MVNVQEIKDKYLVEIFDEIGECGNGIIVGKYLLTAGHIGNRPHLSAYIKGSELRLGKCVIEQYDEHKDGVNDDGKFYDVAIFEIVGIASPLTLADTPIVEGETYTSLFIEHKSSSSPSNIFDGCDKLISQECSAKVLHKVGNFVDCEMSTPLKRGNSGCPLIKDGAVFGILHGGIESIDKPEANGKICIFITSEAIRNLMSEH